MPDGKYNLLLQGIGRAKIIHETDDWDLPYRTADLDPLIESPTMEIDLTQQRRKLSAIFEDHLQGIGGLSRQFQQMLTSAMPTADIADLAAFNLLDDVPLKQSLLAETDIARRVDRLIAALESIERTKAPPPTPVGAQNPSLN